MTAAQEERVHRRADPRWNAKKHPFYRTWRNMWWRCTDPKHQSFSLYGGRGVVVCERWKSFAAFVDDMSPRPEGHNLTLLDKNSGFSPENCRWGAERIGGRRNRAQTMRSHPLYETWHGMWSRCTNAKLPHFKHYGGRGISVCERWSEFWAFVEDMGSRPEVHTLDRIDNDAGYEPSNCRWATQKQQVANRRSHPVPDSQGSKNAMAKLDEASVYAIKRQLEIGVFSRSRLANWFGVCVQSIDDIANNKRWRNVQ